MDVRVLVLVVVDVRLVVEVRVDVAVLEPLRELVELLVLVAEVVEVFERAAERVAVGVGRDVGEGRAEYVAVRVEEAEAVGSAPAARRCRGRRLGTGLGATARSSRSVLPLRRKDVWRGYSIT